MSRRNSVGDLVPRDITEILLRESRANKGKRKQGASFGRAFSWLRGTKRKSGNNGQSRGSRPGENRAGKLSPPDQASAKAASKQEDARKLTVHYTAQENVFIEGSRPQYLEDLHTEAQEGLKVLQQEGHNNGTDYGDDQSVRSAMARLQPEVDTEARERKGSLESGSTAAESVSTGSTVSPRSAPMRQGSTFKPLSPVKRLDKSRKRSRRTTIMGIPHHVQKELGLERGHLYRQNAEEQFRNGGEGAPGIIVIPTIDGEVPVANNEGARVHLQNLEVLQSSKEEELLKRHIEAVYGGDVVFNHKKNSGEVPIQRPKSLAVPGLTTSNFLQEPQVPVMSISPQATYLSKIIPNAVMPAAVDVIEISRSRSRSSVRTLSKNNLATASPASSRSSAQQGLSATSNWSRSKSSETIVSNSSTISSKDSASTPCAPNDIGEAREPSRQPTADLMSMNSSISWVSSDSGAKQRANAEAPIFREADNAENLQNERLFVRSLSVVKTKMPPTPPRRTYSLHHEKMRRRSREMTVTKGISESKSACVNMSWAKAGKSSNAVTEAQSPVTSNSAGSPAYFEDSSSLANSRSSAPASPLNLDQTNSSEGIPAGQFPSSGSSPQKLPSPANKFERTLSPSSGYSSQSGTPTFSAKEICPPSPEKKKILPVKPERIGAQSPPALSISSSLTSLSSGASDPTHQEAPANHRLGQLPKPSSPVPVVHTKATPASAGVLVRDMLDIPPPPKVKAPSPPPPETWMQNKRTLELLYGSNVFATTIALKKQVEKPGASRSQIKEHSSDGTQSQNKDMAIQSGKQEDMSLSKEEPLLAQKSDHSLESETDSVPMQTKASLEVEVKENECSVVETDEKGNLLVQRQEDKSPVALQKPIESPVEMEETSIKGKDIPVAQIMEPEKVMESPLTDPVTDVKVNTASQREISAVLKDKTTPSNIDKCLSGVLTIGDQSSIQSLSADPPKLSKTSPPPSPPPAHHPPPPPSKKQDTNVVSGSIPEDDVEISASESSWPPPPPPIMESSALVFEDDLEFPPPPPPILQDIPLDRVESSPVTTEIHEFSMTSEEPTGESTLINSFHSDTPMHVQVFPAASQPNVSDRSLEDDSLEEVPSPPQKIPFLEKEVSPSPSEGSPSQKEVLYPSEEAHHMQEKLIHTKKEAPPQKEFIPPPPQEAPPLPPVAFSTTPSAPLVNSTPESSMTLTSLPAMNVSHSPPFPAENQNSVSFRRPQSLANRASKDQLSRIKSSPMPKEDANIPLVTPSLLQMVRLRSVNVGDDQALALCEDGKAEDGKSPSPDQSHGQTISQSVPQKPIRKSLSGKSPTGTGALPSMRLQEAIRMKTAAMSSRDGLPTRLSMRSSVSSASGGEMGLRVTKVPECGDQPKSPASTASFIFSKSAKKVVIETPSSPDAQSNLKQSLMVELMQVSDQTKSVSTNGKPSSQIKKPGKVPPPVAKKPVHGPNLSDKPVPPSENMGNFQCELNSSSSMGAQANGQNEVVQPAGQQAQAVEGENASHQETMNNVKVTHEE